MTLEELASRTNAWCDEHGVAPASGQSSPSLSERTLRYYRTLGLLDPPEHGGGAGYGDKHLHQLIAIRALQAQGLPLSRVQTLLYGRSAEELRAIAAHAQNPQNTPRLPAIAPAPAPRACPSYALGNGYLLVCGNGRSVPHDLLRSIADLLASPRHNAAFRPQDKPPTPSRRNR